jgi:hypothetical protein
MEDLGAQPRGIANFRPWGPAPLGGEFNTHIFSPLERAEQREQGRTTSVCSGRVQGFLSNGFRRLGSW